MQDRGSLRTGLRNAALGAMAALQSWQMCPLKIVRLRDEQSLQPIEV